MAVNATTVLSNGKIVKSVVRENSTCELRLKFYDRNSAQIYSGDLGTATMTLYNEADDSVINSQTAVDVSADFNASGTYSMERQLTVADNAVIDKSPYSLDEWHVAHFVITITDPASTLTEDVRFRVENLKG